MSDSAPIAVRPRRRRRVAGTLAVAIWLVIPIVAGGIAISRARQVVAPRQIAVWAPAVAPDPSSSEAGSVALAWAAQPDLLAPAWTGDVEQVLVKAGQELSTGVPLVAVGGIQRIAANTAVPFARPLGAGAQGADVKALNGLLTQLGLPSTAGTDFTGATARGVLALAKRLGAPIDPNVFDPSWIVYLPSPMGRVGTVKLQVAAPAPAHGTLILSLAPSLLAARAYSQTLLSSLAPAGSDASAPSGGDTSPSPTALPATASDIAAGASIVRDGVTLGVVGEHGDLDPPSVAAVLALIEPGQAALAVQFVTPTPSETVQVPSGSLITGPDGATCVERRSTSGSSGSVVPVDVVDSFVGTSVVSGLQIGDEVRVRPKVSRRRQCRSH